MPFSKPLLPIAEQPYRTPEEEFQYYNEIIELSTENLDKIRALRDRLAGELIDFKYYDLFKDYTIFFITLNPRIDASKWKTDVKKIMKKWKKNKLVSSIFNFEFSTKNKKTIRLHSHGLIFVKKYRNNIGGKWITSLNGFLLKQIMGDKQKVDYKRITTFNRLSQLIKYIVGDKSTDKHRDVDEDKRIRREHFKPALKDYYVHFNEDYMINSTNCWLLRECLTRRVSEAISGTTLNFE